MYETSACDSLSKTVHAFWNIPCRPHSHSILFVRNERQLCIEDWCFSTFFHYADSDASGSHRASLNDEFYFPGNDIVFLELQSRREIVNLSTPTDVIRSNRCMPNGTVENRLVGVECLHWFSHSQTNNNGESEMVFDLSGLDKT